MKYTLSILILFFVYACQSQVKDRQTLGIEHAKEELQQTLQNEGHNVVDGKNIIIKDSITALAIAEQILFSTYSKANITKQRPYEVYHINNYWLIRGTLPLDYVGGTFLLIIDDRNSKILKLTHGK